MYVPALLANAEALKEGAEVWEVEIDGATWKQKTLITKASVLHGLKKSLMH